MMGVCCVGSLSVRGVGFQSRGDMFATVSAAYRVLEKVSAYTLVIAPYSYSSKHALLYNATLAVVLAVSPLFLSCASKVTPHFSRLPQLEAVLIRGYIG